MAPGTGGKVVKDDVLSHIEQNGGDGASSAPARPTPPGRRSPRQPRARRGRGACALHVRQPLDPHRDQLPHLEVDTLDRRRRQLNEALKVARRDMKVSFTHLIGYAIAARGARPPRMSHTFGELDGKPQRIIHEHVNLGLAVDVQRKDGTRTLIVPVIKGADALDFAGFREVYEEMIRKTRDGSLSPDDMQGATMTLTNPGGIGTVASVPRLMPGQGCIIATGAIVLPPGCAGWRSPASRSWACRRS